MNLLRRIISLWVLMLSCSKLPALPTVVPMTEAPAEDYRICPKDQIQFQVFGEPDTLVVQRVSASGEIPVPMLGDFKVSGLTLREAEKRIAARYIARGIFVDVQVILNIQAYAPHSVSVLGQVGKPGVVDFPLERDSIGIVDAITQAGGFTRVSKADSVRVIRKNEGREESIVINVSAYLDNKAAGNQFMLRDDDIVYVPERTF